LTLKSFLAFLTASTVPTRLGPTHNPMVRASDYQLPVPSHKRTEDASRLNPVRGEQSSV